MDGYNFVFSTRITEQSYYAEPSIFRECVSTHIYSYISMVFVMD